MAPAAAGFNEGVNPTAASHNTLSALMHPAYTGWHQRWVWCDAAPGRLSTQHSSSQEQLQAAAGWLPTLTSMPGWGTSGPTAAASLTARRHRQSGCAMRSGRALQRPQLLLFPPQEHS